MRLDQSNDDNAESNPAESNGAGDLTDVLTGGETEFVATEEKKTISKATLGLMLLVVLGGAGLYAMHLRSGPKTAAAAPEALQANQTITTFLSGGEGSIKLMEQALRETEKVVKRFLNYPNATQVPLAELRTNPFRKAALELPSGAPQTDVLSKRRREEERQAVLKAVQLLQLQSVMHSTAQKACMINNTLYRESQMVDGFTVEKINPNAVIIRQGQYRFELRMQR